MLAKSDEVDEVSDSCTTSKVRGMETVSVGFIREVLGRQAVAYYTDNEESFLRRRLHLEDWLERYEYQDEAKEVSIEVHCLFQELIDDMNAQFNALLPKSPEETKKK